MSLYVIFIWHTRSMVWLPISQHSKQRCNESPHFSIAFSSYILNQSGTMVYTKTKSAKARAFVIQSFGAACHSDLKYVIFKSFEYASNAVHSALPVFVWFAIKIKWYTHAHLAARLSASSTTMCAYLGNIPLEWQRGICRHALLAVFFVQMILDVAQDATERTQWRGRGRDAWKSAPLCHWAFRWKYCYTANLLRHDDVLHTDRKNAVRRTKVSHFLWHNQPYWIISQCSQLEDFGTNEKKRKEDVGGSVAGPYKILWHNFRPRCAKHLTICCLSARKHEENQPTWIGSQKPSNPLARQLIEWNWHCIG